MVEERIAHTQKVIDEARKASHEEGKSSMGDKYETTKSLLQNEQEKMAVMLNEGLKMKKGLQQIGCKNPKEIVEAGSLVETSGPTFYLAVSLGKLTVEGKEVFVVSPVSPIGKALLGKKQADTIEFNATFYTIERLL